MKGHDPSLQPKVDPTAEYAMPDYLNWADQTFHIWSALHNYKQSHEWGYAQDFPQRSSVPLTSNDMVEASFNGMVAGRLVSNLRQPLSFYRKMPRRYMKDTMMTQWLRYIICYGSFVPSDVVPVVQRCLQSRNPTLAKQGMAPLWGYHETFYHGEWGYYALLGTTMGRYVAFLVARNKREDCLGMSLLDSVTVFAADSVRELQRDHYQDPKRSVLVKWPVLIWHVLPYNEHSIDNAKRFEPFYLDSYNQHRQTAEGT